MSLGLSNKVKLEKHKIFYLLIGFALSLPFLGIIASYLKFWHHKGTIFLPSGSYTIPIAGVFGILALIIYLKNKSIIKEDKSALLIPFALCLFIAFVSDYINRGENFFIGPTLRGEILLLGAISLFFIKKQKSNFLLFLTFIAYIFLPYFFYTVLEGNRLFSDDHATFFYRLKLLFEEFPNIPFFNPLWNGGIDERAFFATGSLNIFFVSFPLLKLLGVEAAYNLIITFLAYILPLISTLVSARILKLSRTTTLIALLLITALDLSWFQWLVTYGTLGFMTSLCLLPIVLAYGCLVLDETRELTLIDLFTLVVAATLMLMWSASGLVFIPFFILTLLQIRRVFKRKYILTILILLITLNAPWIYAFWNVSNVGKFVSNEKKTELVSKEKVKKISGRKFKHRTGKINLKKSIKIFRKHVQTINPLLLFLSLPGFFFLRKKTRILFITTSIWLLFLGSVLVPVKPQLELDRMLLILSVVLVFPTSLSISKLIDFFESEENDFLRLSASILSIFVLGYLCYTPLVNLSVAKKRSAYGYVTQTSFSKDLSTFIKERKKEGRILFSGCLVQEFDGGHFAPLSVMGEKPLIASSPVGNIWWYTDVFPKEYRTPKDRRVDYLNLYNVDGVFAHEPKYREYFDKDPNFKRTKKFGSFFFYERLNYKSNYFLEGSGKVLSQKNSEVNFKLNTDSAVLKFTWFPFLEVKGCNISKYEVTNKVNFIRLDNCPTNKVLKLKSVNLINRLF